MYELSIVPKRSIDTYNVNVVVVDDPNDPQKPLEMAVCVKAVNNLEGTVDVLDCEGNLRTVYQSQIVRTVRFY